MKKHVNIAIIGMGKWGNHLLENVIRIKGFNVKYICCRKKEDVKLKTSIPIISVAICLLTLVTAC